MAQLMCGLKFDHETSDKFHELARLRDQCISYLIRGAVNDLIEKTAWQIVEVEKTLEDIDSGKVSTRPLDDFLTEAKEILSKQS
ncbi:hypothetical protein [Endozoicomonas sp. 8E]|uniref:hypothetical protein n=1 Tax=Endozoicomonas sp. 8E TaxID=3035692 RepID=UPI0029393C10|nr:hypothetical protein [Endozoicomonas sp. 8E]WOG25830.1 hypothetical protein P6910_14735 [Endozoicomonas sp. 8E]